MGVSSIIFPAFVFKVFFFLMGSSPIAAGGATNSTKNGQSFLTKWRERFLSNPSSASIGEISFIGEADTKSRSLERYLFLGFPFIAVLAMSDKKLFKYFVIFTATLFSNLIWAFYRRRFGKIDHLFTDYGLFLVRVISFINVLTYVLFVRSNIGKNLLKLRLWKK